MKLGHGTGTFVVQVRLRDFYAVELACSMVRIITLPCRLPLAKQACGLL